MMSSAPINSICPWSGDPVSPDSVTTYRGHTVAFCNPGCRDKFDTAKHWFDRHIDTVSGACEPGETAIAGVSPYRPRHVRFAGVHKVAELAFKLYTITRSADLPVPDQAIARGLAYATRALPAALEQESNAHPAGYIILHAGETSNWLLIHWWAHSDIAMQLLASAQTLEGKFRSLDHRRFHACVWENIVISHERNAWVRRAMTKDGNVADYLADVLADGAY